MVHAQLPQLRILDLLARHQVGSTGRWKATSTKMSRPSPYRTRIPTWNPLVWHQESRFAPDAGPNTCPKIGQTWRPKNPVHSPALGGQDGALHDHLSTAIDSLTHEAHETYLLASQVLLVAENRHCEVGQFCPKIGQPARN